LKTGKILKWFNARDGRRVVLRTPKWDDIDDLLGLINSLVDEEAEILMTQRFTREAETEWLRKALSRLEKNELFFLVAKIDNKVVASSDFQIQGEDKENRGKVGIIVKSGYRNLGIGTAIMLTHVKQARLLGLKALTVNVFATNKRAIHVYENAGFVKTSTIPKKHYRKGEFIDEITMTRPIGEQQKIKQGALLYDLRKSVSGILNKPFFEKIDHRLFKPDQKILALWAADCAKHVLPYFEDKYPNDDRPRKAIEAARKWAETGVFKMVDIRKASLDAHAAAKTVKEEDAKYAAHAAGQAVASAHVPTHALGSSLYGIRSAAVHSGIVEDGLIRERSWQLERLREYAKHT
jgi:RimJ/RimL family protein N-acetyltransferase